MLFRDHYHWRKGYPYEFSSHIPFIVSWPSDLLVANDKNDTAKAIRIPQEKRGQKLSEVVELRDLFPTFLDIGNGAEFIPDDINGSSILDLILSKSTSDKKHYSDQMDLHHLHEGKPINAWRSWIDLEHNICYNVTNHWNALTDGKIKYIYRAYFGDEQLFDLLKDPYEMTDVASDPAYSATLKLWRARLVQQFVNEARGETWVKNGSLVPRKKGTLYSPHYPSLSN